MKSPEMESMCDEISMAIFGRKRTDALSTHTCVDCQGQADSFKDTKSAREYELSGLCQNCQDRIFGG